MPAYPAFPELVYAHPDTWDAHRKRGRRLLISTLIFLLLGCAAASLLIPTTHRCRCGSPRIKCASNLRQIGQAMLLYSMDFNHQYPNTIEELLVEDITPDVFVCPSSDDEVAATSAPTTQQAIQSMRDGIPHCSYVYLAQGMRDPVCADAVLAYELLGHHGTGSNVLFGDGSVTYVDVKDMQKLIAEINAGLNPGPTAKGIHP